MDYTCYYQSPLGQLLLACDDVGLVGLWFEDAKYYGFGLATESIDIPNHPILLKAKAWLDAYFAKSELPSLPALHLRGTSFRQLVWQQLLEVPYGQTVTYGALAKQVASQKGLTSMSSQAIGGAVGRNPLSIIIPCHRVLGARGQLTGYAGGLERKLGLLELEGILVSRDNN